MIIALLMLLSALFKTVMQYTVMQVIVLLLIVAGAVVICVKKGFGPFGLVKWIFSTDSSFWKWIKKTVKSLKKWITEKLSFLPAGAANAVATIIMIIII